MDYWGSPVGGMILFTIVTSLISLCWGYATAPPKVNRKLGTFKPLPLMIFVASLCSALFLGFYSFAFQSNEFLSMPTSSDAGTPAPGLRIAPITVAAGLFGGVLFIAFTVLKFRSHVQAEEKLVIEQKGAALQTAEHYSQRFAQAAELLGSDKAAVRMGGVYALSALADEWPANRQQCIDLLCGYLRNPIKMSIRVNGETSNSTAEDVRPSPKVPRELITRPERSGYAFTNILDDYRSLRSQAALEYATNASPDEVAVRKAILSSIARGTSRALEDPTTWSNLSFNLSRSYLEDLDFSQSSFMKSINFNESIFIGSTNFRSVSFKQNAQFDGCLFEGPAWFSGSRFLGHTWFRVAEFRKNASFGRVEFNEGLMFNFAHFEDLPHFRENILGRSDNDELSDIPFANFDGVYFDGDLTWCPDFKSVSIWDYFSHIQFGYTIICERFHPDSLIHRSRLFQDSTPRDAATFQP